MSISSLKSKVINLRKQGKSYNEINKLLGVPKSTLSGWLKTFPLSEQIKKKNLEKVKLIWAKNITDFNRQRSKKYQRETQQLIENCAKETPLLSARDLYFLGLALFWAEGTKREKWAVRFANSDPIIIKAIVQFFRKICKVPNNKFALRIHLHPNIEENKAKKFWSEITKLPINQFRKSQTQITISSKYKRPINQLPYGTLHIIISDAYLNKKIKGWILGLSRQFEDMPR